MMNITKNTTIAIIVSNENKDGMVLTPLSYLGFVHPIPVSVNPEGQLGVQKQHPEL